MEVYPREWERNLLINTSEARKGRGKMRILSRLEYLDFNDTSASIQCISMVMTLDHPDMNDIKKSSET